MKYLVDLPESEKIALAASVDVQLTESERAEVVERLRLAGHQRPDGRVSAIGMYLYGKEVLERRNPT